MENLRILRQIIELADSASYRKAAEKLGITHSALSQTVKRLEETYQVPLFERQHRSTQPTVYGEVLLHAARHSLAEFDQVKHEIQLMKSMELGRLKIGCDAGFAHLISSVLAKMFAAHPKLKFNLVSESWRNAQESLRAQQIDLYVGLRPDHCAKDIHYQRFKLEPPMIVCRQDHPLAKKQPLYFSDLNGYTFAGSDVPDWYFQILQNNIAGAITNQQTLAELRDLFLTTFDFNILKDLVLKTDIVALCPNTLFKSLRQQGLVHQLIFANHPLKAGLYGVVGSFANQRRAPAAALFCQYILDLFAANLGENFALTEDGYDETALSTAFDSENA